MKILTHEDGRVILYPNGHPPERPGWTRREVETLPAGKGLVKWDGNQLVRAPTELTVGEKLLLLFESISSPESRSKARPLKLAITDAIRDGQLDEVPHLLADFNAGDDQTLKAAMATALAALSQK